MLRGQLEQLNHLSCRVELFKFRIPQQYAEENCFYISYYLLLKLLNIVIYFRKILMKLLQWHMLSEVIAEFLWNSASHIFVEKFRLEFYYSLILSHTTCSGFCLNFRFRNKYINNVKCSNLQNTYKKKHKLVMIHHPSASWLFRLFYFLS